MANEYIAQIQSITKCFGPTVALDDVTISVRRGEILGLIGENGSGKSTVTSILSGMQKPDSGEMRYKEKNWAPSSMLEALQNGIGMIVQENGTVPGISVAENIFLGAAGKFSVNAFISRKKMLAEAAKVLERLGIVHIAPQCLAGSLDLQDRKLVEIARVMNSNPDILVVDETTTALSQTGRKILYTSIKRMKQENKAVIFISHDLDEIMEICDCLTVLRDGRIIVTFTKEQFNEELIKTSMIGRTLQGDYYRSDMDGSFDREVVLELKEGCLGDKLDHLSLQLHKGEILGIGGLSHCGMHTLGKVLFGAVKPQTGTVLVKGEAIKCEADAMKHRVGYVAKDRDTEALCAAASIRDNIAAGGLDKFAVSRFLLLPGKEKAYVQEQIKALRIKCRDMGQQVSALSGGNKQKVVFGKWIGRGSEILILDCPTRGVDIGVKQAMYQLMYRMKQEGKAIVIISEELSELIGMSDRLLIMKDGVLQKEFSRSEKLCEADLIQYMI